MIFGTSPYTGEALMGSLTNKKLTPKWGQFFNVKLQFRALFLGLQCLVAGDDAHHSRRKGGKQSRAKNV